MALLLVWLFRGPLRRCFRGFMVHLLSFALIWSPVFQARAIAPAIVLVPVAIAAARVFMVAATRIGPLLTHTNIGIGVGIGSLGYLVDKNWEEIVSYTANATATFNAAVSGGVMSFAAMAGQVGVQSVDTDVASYSWSSAAGNVVVSYGNVPMKDALAGTAGDSGFAFVARNDGKLLFQPLAGFTYSSTYNTSGFKSYLCPVMTSPTLDPLAEACRMLPEVPFATFTYGTQFGNIGVSCNDPQDCAKAYVSARLVQLTWLQGNSTNPDTGARNYANSVQNVSVDFGSCFDARYSAYTSFPGYRCPATLSYSIAKLEGPSPDVYQAVVEPYSIDVNLNRPPFTSAQTLNDFIDRYPLAGSQPLSPAAIANIINAMFVQASSRAGYDGINYFPITAADVVSALQPGEVVPLSSLVAPVAGTGAGTGNPAIPGTGSTTVDLGPNPDIKAPVLEGIPTAAQIMAPVFDLFPSLRNFSVPGHTSQCPALVIPLWGSDISTSKHCELIESQRAPLGAAALVGWSIAAIIIVLGA